MSKAINLGKKVMQMNNLKENEYDGVEVWGDDETLIGSAPANVTLYNPFKVSFPWNTGGTQGQTIAEAIWSKLDGYEYNPYEAENAILDPAAQLGDLVKVNGSVSIIAMKAPKMDALYATDIAAPQESEEDTEYNVETITSRLQKAVRKANGAYATLQVNVDSILAEVTDGNGNFTALVLDSNGVVITGKDGRVSIAGDQIQAGSLDLSENISFSSVASTASNAAEAAYQITHGTYNGGTFIDGDKIYSPNIYGDNLTLHIGKDYPTTRTVGEFKIDTCLDSVDPENLTTIFRVTSPTDGYPSAIVDGAASCAWNFPTTAFSGNASFNGTTLLNGVTVAETLIVDYGTAAPTGTAEIGQVYFQIAS